MLVTVMGALLTGLCAYSVFVAYPQATSFTAPPLVAVEISLGFAFLVRALQAATPGGAVCGGMICFLITSWTRSLAEPILRTGLTPLILLFVLTFFSTRAGRTKKVRTGLAEGRRGRRAAQVIANLSVAAVSVSPPVVNQVQQWMAYCCVSGLVDAWAFQAAKVMCVAALVEATADTVSSEIGQAFGGDPVLITRLRRVEPGTDGAVTLLGSCAGVAAGALVAVAGGWAIHLNAVATLTSLGAGIAGLFFDSFLGATVERRGWIGNDLVNFTSTLFAAVLAGVVYRLVVL
jgi:uncharacterized protein (TIGR00297 family)